MIEKLSFLFSLLWLMLLPLLSAQTAFSQCETSKEAGINGAIADTSFKTISFNFDLPLTPSDKPAAGVASSWVISNISSQSAAPVTVTNIVLQAADSLNPQNAQTAEISYTGNFISGDTYLLSTKSLTFSGCKPQKPVFTIIVIPQPPNPTATPAAPSPFVSGKSNGRSDSDIYFAGQIEGARKGKATKTIDLKVELPLGVSIFREHQDLIPYIDLKASSNKKADADSLKFGALLRSPFNVRNATLNKVATNVVWEIDGRIEGNKNLKFINGVLGNTLYFVTPVLGSGKVQLYTQPFAGLEIGNNLKTPVTQARNQKIMRPNIGASLYLNFFTGRKLLDASSLQVDYIRRWLLRREVSINKDDNGNFIPVFVGKGPRDYVQTKFQIDFTKYLGVAIGYDYGRIPPIFNLVDSRFSIGFVYKKQLSYRPK